MSLFGKQKSETASSKEQQQLKTLTSLLENLDLEGKSPQDKIEELIQHYMTRGLSRENAITKSIELAEDATTMRMLSKRDAVAAAAAQKGGKKKTMKSKRTKLKKLKKSKRTKLKKSKRTK